jgi:hypothetical protein
MKCIKCESDNTATFAMVYKTGATRGTIDGKAKDVSFGIESAFSHTSIKASTTTCSILVEEVAPPTKPSGIAFVAFLGGIILIILCQIVSSLSSPAVGIALLILSLTGIVWLAISWHRKLMKSYRTRAAKWPNRWICLSCGAKWISDEKIGA